MSRGWLVGLVVGIGVLIPGIVLAQEPSATSTPDANWYFDATCPSACWQELVPGTSTVEDVEVFFAAYRNSFAGPGVDGDFDPITGLLVNGEYRFTLRPWLHEGVRPLRSTVVIEEGVVSNILVHPNRDISLGQVLDVMGTPEEILLTMASWVKPILTLGYQDRTLVIPFEPRASIPGYVLPADTCQMTAMRDDYVIGLILYYSPELAREFEQQFAASVAAATDPIMANVRYVPLATWESWLAGEVDQTCIDTWAQLPEPTREVISTPTPTSFDDQ